MPKGKAEYLAIITLILLYFLSSCTLLDAPAEALVDPAAAQKKNVSTTRPEKINPSLKSAFAQHFEIANKTKSHYAYILETGDDALLARIHLIKNAQQSIDIQTFIWAADETAGLILHELWLAAERGIMVRLLIDDLSLRAQAQYIAYFATLHPNIEIKHYNPPSQNINASLFELIMSELSFRDFNQRMHNKVFIVDGQFGITGGRNHADDYFDRGTERSFKDRDVLVIGPVVQYMTDSFNEYWQYHLSIASLDMLDIHQAVISGQVHKPKQEISDYVAPKAFQSLLKCATSKACTDRRITQMGYAIEKIDFIVDLPGKVAENDKRFAATTEHLAASMQSATHSIVIQSPYLVIDQFGTGLFSEIKENKPELEVIVSTNSLAAADHFYAYAFSYENKKKYLKKFRWQLFELKPKPHDIDMMVPAIADINRTKSHYVCIHAKTYVIDDNQAWIGSFNLDPRSITLNTEASVVIYDREFAMEVKRRILNDTSPANSWTIGVRHKLPIFSFFSSIAENIFKVIPFFNIWPFQYATSFELKVDATVVPFHHKDFYQNYRQVGQFPGTGLTTKGLKTRLTKAFFGPAEPLI